MISRLQLAGGNRESPSSGLSDRACASVATQTASHSGTIRLLLDALVFMCARQGEAQAPGVLSWRGVTGAQRRIGE